MHQRDIFLQPALKFIYIKHCEVLFAFTADQNGFIQLYLSNLKTKHFYDINNVLHFHDILL